MTLAKINLDVGALVETRASTWVFDDAALDAELRKQFLLPPNSVGIVLGRRYVQYLGSSYSRVLFGEVICTIHQDFIFAVE